MISRTIEMLFTCKKIFLHYLVLKVTDFFAFSKLAIFFFGTLMTCCLDKIGMDYDTEGKRGLVQETLKRK